MAMTLSQSTRSAFRTCQLPDDFKERILEYIQPRFDECRAQLPRDVSLKCNEMASRGLGSSSVLLTEVNKIFERQIETRVAIVWEAINRIATAMNIAYSDTLIADLKMEVLRYYVPISLWELPDSYPRSGLITEAEILSGLRQDLTEKRERELKKVDGEIDLLVDRLRRKQASAPDMLRKEPEQKFGILLSPAQAPKDFIEWETQLGSDGHSISVLFIDIDDFKSLNTNYSETKIDETVLPEAMKLVKSLVSLRGEAYRQGGDEFIVMLPNQDISEANVLAEKIRSTFEEHAFNIDDKHEKLTVSIGIASWPSHGASYQEVLQEANNAKMGAKSCKNKVKLSKADSSDR